MCEWLRAQGAGVGLVRASYRAQGRWVCGVFRRSAYDLHTFRSATDRPRRFTAFHPKLDFCEAERTCS